MLKYRLLTAFTLGPLLLWAFIALPDNYYAVLLAIITLFAAREWGTMARLVPSVASVYWLAFIPVVYASWWALQNVESFYQNILYLACAWWLAGFFVLQRYNRGIKETLFNPGLRAVLGVIILIPTFLSLYMVRHQYEVSMLVYFLFLIWFADSGAYFAGRRFGKNKLLPNVSPGKTWEGVAGAFVVTIIYCLSFSYFSNVINGQNYLAFLLISIVTVIVSIEGDLMESMFKRQVNLKDSSNLLPGHGGMLDRIDSLTSATPVFMTGMYFLPG